MKRNNLIFIALLLQSLLATSCNLLKQSSKGARVAPVEYSKDAAVNYLLTYKDAAVAEMERTGIPASVKLAQAFLESAYGTSELARSANNHFGIKCGGTAWKGDTYKKEDDDYDKNGKKIESCFRKYDMVEESFYDHSEFLRDPRKYNRYGFLFNLDRTDYKSWARGLQSSGYATAGDYADKLINLIERYQLYRYDKGGAAGVPDLPTPPNGNPLPGTEPPTVPSTGTLPAARRVGRINDSKVVLARSGETIETIARMYRLDPADVADYNDRGYTPGMKLRENTRIFIQAKRSKWRGRDREYMVREGQSIFEISQLHGLKVEALRDRNGLRDGEEPATGERITLKGRSTRRVRLRTTPLPTDSGQPIVTQPGAQPEKPGSMTPGDEVLFEIDPTKPNNGGTTQPGTTQPGTTPPLNTGGNKPSTTDTPYPSDPWPSQPTTQQPGTTNPQSGQPQPQPTQPIVVPEGQHLVVKGDTLFSLSKKYNLTVARLKQLNNMTTDAIKLGQLLRIR
jgi:LysM repeat protein